MENALFPSEDPALATSERSAVRSASLGTEQPFPCDTHFMRDPRTKETLLLAQTFSAPLFSSSPWHLLPAAAPLHESPPIPRHILQDARYQHPCDLAGFRQPPRTPATTATSLDIHGGAVSTDLSLLAPISRIFRQGRCGATSRERLCCNCPPVELQLSAGGAAIV
jgi:hypothetical protein